MSGLSVSVVIVSHGRPDALHVALTVAGQIDHANFEIVVVADRVSLAGLQDHPLAGQIKLVRYDYRNISAARNAGVDAAAGEIIAFIDADCVPATMPHVPHSHGCRLQNFTILLRSSREATKASCRLLSTF